MKPSAPSFVTGLNDITPDKSRNRKLGFTWTVTAFIRPLVQLVIASRHDEDKDSPLELNRVPTCIFDSGADLRTNPAARRFTFIVGIVLFAWYVREIFGAITGDVRDFPAAFHESPVLTIVFAILKPIGYLSFGALFTLMVYVPLRDTIFKRTLSGRLQSVTPQLSRRGKPQLLIDLGLQHHIVVPDRNDLADVLTQAASKQDEARITLGAFNSVLKVETLP